MRKYVFALCLGCAATSALAQEQQEQQAAELDPCAQTEAWFNLAIDSRKMGETQAAVRRSLRPDMGRQAADQLAEFVFALPEAQLTREIGTAARKQCEGL